MVGFSLWRCGTFLAVGVRVSHTRMNHHEAPKDVKEAHAMTVASAQPANI
jgi:hypothetical protein